MKKRFSVVLSMVLVLTMVMSVVSLAADNSLEEIEEKGKFIVGLDDSFPPMGFRNEEGEIDGFDIDLAKEAASRLGVDVEFKPVEWDGVLFSLKNGNIDVIWNGLTITEERAKKIDFTEPYLDNRQIIVVQKGSDIESKADLAGTIVGVQLGSSSVSALKSEPEVVDSLEELRKFSNNMEALLDLRTGRIDAVVVDEIVGRYYIRQKPDTYVILDDHFGKESYGVGVRAEDDSFREALDQVLNEMKEDGTAAEIAREWFGEDIVK
ncbi:MAG: amino acid ABC transporter substrate-binding protein [Bacillota bacterium]